jgi:Na+-transporting methylmalonyl-CoA/oxaloacetate decarboxylase gamma subunit
VKNKRTWQFAIPAILVMIVLVVSPLSSMQASVRLEKPIPAKGTVPSQVKANDDTWLVAAVVVVVAVSAVATTTTDLAVAGELTVMTEVAARTTGELGEPIPVYDMAQQDKDQIAHDEFDS